MCQMSRLGFYINTSESSTVSDNDGKIGIRYFVGLEKSNKRVVHLGLDFKTGVRIPASPQFY